MNATADDSARPPKTFGLASIILFTLAIVAIGGMLMLRWTAADRDYAVVNAITGVAILLAWILASSGLFASGLPRWMCRTAFGVPILGAAVFFSLYRVERVDGELKPHFVSRWQPEQALATPTGLSEAAQDLAWLQPRDTDSPQYLGPARDGVVRGVTLVNNWSQEPPQIAWKNPIGDGWSGFAIQGDLAITMEQRDAQEWVTAYDIRSGEMIWKYAIPGLHFNVMGGTGPRSTPTIHAGRVYALSAISTFACLDLTTGEEIWSTELLDETQAEFERLVAWGRSGSPLIVDDKVIVPLGGVAKSPACLIALDRLSGEEIFRAGQDQISYSSPTLMTLAGVEQLVYTSETKLAGYDLTDGQLLWEIPAPGTSAGDSNIAQPVPVGDDQVLLTKGYGAGGRLIQVSHDDASGWDATELWHTNSVLKTKFTTAVIRDGYAYALSDGILECVEAATGKRQWKRGRYRQGQLLLVGEHLLITSEGGEIVLVAADPEEFRELGRLQVIGDVTWNTAAISGNRLLMRNSDEIACIILPTQETFAGEGSGEAVPTDATSTDVAGETDQ